MQNHLQKKKFTRSAKKLNDSELDLLNETNFDFDLSENESSQDMSQSEVDESLNVSDLKEKPKINKKKSCKSNPGISKKETISKHVYEHEGYKDFCYQDSPLVAYRFPHELFVQLTATVSIHYHLQDVDLHYFQLLIDKSYLGILAPPNKHLIDFQMTILGC